MADLLEQFGSIDIYLFDQILRGRIGARHSQSWTPGVGPAAIWCIFSEKGIEVFGVDADPQGWRVRGAWRHPCRRVYPAGNFRVGNIEEMSFPDDFADVVLSSAVLHFARRR